MQLGGPLRSQGQPLSPHLCLFAGQLAAGTCEIVTLDRDSSQPRRTIARQTARCACRKGQIAGTTRARPACVDGKSRGCCPSGGAHLTPLLFNQAQGQVSPPEQLPPGQPCLVHMQATHWLQPRCLGYGSELGSPGDYWPGSCSPSVWLWAEGQGPCHVLDSHGDLSRGFWLMLQAGGGLVPSRSGRHQHLPPRLGGMHRAASPVGSEDEPVSPVGQC